MYKIDTIMQISPKELKFVSGNRLVDERHVSKLKAAIQEENMLHINPIKINAKGEIIDGQHRTTAAIELGLKTVTCLIVAANVHDAQRLNQHSKNWSGLDFANYWAKQGKKDYADFIDFVHMTGINPSVCLELLSPGGGRHSLNFKRGIFKIHSLDYSYRFCDKLEIFKEWLPRDYTKRPFIRAMWHIYNNKNFSLDMERLIHKLKLVGLKTTQTTEQYLEQLENAYNWKVRTEEKVRFTE